MGQREAVRTSGGNANGCITSDISALSTRNILDKNDKNRGFSKKVEVFRHVILDFFKGMIYDCLA